MGMTQGLKRAVLVNAKGLATIDDHRRRSWADLSQRVAQLAGALKALGLQAGDRVAMLAFNSDRYLEYFYAVPWAGGVIMPLNVRLAAPELVAMLNDAQPKILMVDEAFQSLLPTLSQAASLKHVILAGDPPHPPRTQGGESSHPPRIREGDPSLPPPYTGGIGGVLNYEGILAAAKPAPDAERTGDDIAGIFYTGGTTGAPKGVMLTHRNVVSNAMSMLLSIHKGQPWVFLHTAPMFHIADSQWVVGATIQSGTHVFIPRFNPEETLKAIQTHRVTHCAMVPTMVNRLVNFSGVENYDSSSLKAINYGGSPMPPAVAARAQAVFPGCEFFAGYGQTETSPAITLLDSKYHVLEGPLAGKIASVGQPVFNMEVKIVDDNDHELPRGTVGEIITRGLHVMAGYWNKPEETAQALRGGWLHTGDVGYMDEDGFIFIVDRLKDMIISGGENIYPVEVENALHQHPAVAMCAVIGIPSETWGEAVHAIVVLREGQSAAEAELIQHCRAHIAGYKCPRSVDIGREPLPMSGAGKILKRELRAPFWQGQARRIN